MAFSSQSMSSSIPGLSYNRSSLIPGKVGSNGLVFLITGAGIGSDERANFVFLAIGNGAEVLDERSNERIDVWPDERSEAVIRGRLVGVDIGRG